MVLLVCMVLAGVGMLEVRLLGQFEVLRDEKHLAIPTRNAQALFAYLVLNPENPIAAKNLPGCFGPIPAKTMLAATCAMSCGACVKCSAQPL